MNTTLIIIMREREREDKIRHDTCRVCMNATQCASSSERKSPDKRDLRHCGRTFPADTQVCFPDSLSRVPQGRRNWCPLCCSSFKVCRSWPEYNHTCYAHCTSRKFFLVLIYIFPALYLRFSPYPFTSFYVWAQGIRKVTLPHSYKQFRRVPVVLVIGF